MLFQISLFVALAAPLQESAESPAPATVSDAGGTGAAAIGAQELESRIHEMRMNLLLGGEQVRRAEAEARDFYSQKGELVDQRLDGVHAELSEKRASYDLALDRALTAPAPENQKQALGEAARMHREIGQLEGEAGELEKRRKRLSEIVASVEARDRERQRLAAEIETSVDTESGLLGLPFAGIGLAPAAETATPAAPLEEDGLVQDLLQRDPRAARRLLFQADPAAYWRRFPLRPPEELVRRAISFPPADLPGRR